MCLENSLQFLEPLLELSTIASTQPRLLPLLVLALSIVTSAPPTRGEIAIAFYFSLLAQLASISLVSMRGKWLRYIVR
jgi:hypothetical protein